MTRYINSIFDGVGKIMDKGLKYVQENRRVIQQIPQHGSNVTYIPYGGFEGQTVVEQSHYPVNESNTQRVFTATQREEMRERERLKRRIEELKDEINKIQIDINEGDARLRTIQMKKLKEKELRVLEEQYNRSLPETEEHSFDEAEDTVNKEDSENFNGGYLGD